MGRELRRVPANWEHPKKRDGSYQPMFNRYYGDELKDWLNQNEQWEKGVHPDLIEDPQLKEEYPFFAMYHGDPPSIDYYQTKIYDDEDLTHIQLYETTSEGTPASPVFHKDDFDKLCEYAAENVTTFAHFKATKEAWKKMLSDNFVFHQSEHVLFF